MKRYAYLWDDLVSFENLYLAYRNARRGKRNQRSVERFEFRREYELTRLREQLIDGSYQPGQYRTFMLYDTKARLISAAPFRDRIVHHALCNILEPIFERSFIYDSYASRKGKGTHAAIKRYQQFTRKNTFVLKCDVRKFFPSVDHEILKERLARKIKDPHVLHLAGKIIDNSNHQVAVPGFFPGDDLFTQTARRRGLPIGNQTSQFFGNVYLDPLDHFIKEQLRCKHYLRYVDDFVILDNCKSRLADVREQISEFLMTLRLWLHPTKRVISRTEDGVRFLGLRVWPNRIWCCKDQLRKTRQRFDRYVDTFSRGELSTTEVRQRINAWLGHGKIVTGEQYQSDILSDIIFSRTATE